MGGIYHTTTIETATTPYSTVSHVGRKRTFDQAQGNQPTSSELTGRREFHRPVPLDSSYPPLRAGEIVDVVPPVFSEYSQRKATESTPGATSNPLLDLSHSAYALPEILTRNFTALGIQSIYPWQSECLLRSGALKGKRNLVYTAPTGGGKSLVADILMLKKVIEYPDKKALLVLPYVALVQEKLRWLRKVTEGGTKAKMPFPEQASRWRRRGDENTVRVVGFFGGSRSKVSWADWDIAVCTIEKVRFCCATNGLDL